MQEQLLAKKAKFYVIDATKVARDSGMGGRINTIMQVCFFALSGVLPKDEAIEAIKYSIKKTYGKKGDEVVQMNLKAVDNTLAHLHEVPVLTAKSTAPARCCRRSRPTRRNSSATCSAKSPPATATICRSARSRWTARSRPPRRNTRNAISRWTFRCGTRRSASNV